MAKILTRNNKFRKMVIQNSDNVSVAPKHSIVRKNNQGFQFTIVFGD